MENGWTDLFLRARDEYWAFPPHAVMPLPIPNQALQVIKQQKGLSRDEKVWSAIAIGTTLLTGLLSYLSASPMPLVAAFAFCAIIVAQLEPEIG